MAAVNYIFRRILVNPLLLRNRPTSYRFISTTQKKPETSQVCEPPPVTVNKDFSKPLDEEWVSYGCDEKDKGEDRFLFHTTYFCAFTVICCGLAFFKMYAPDKGENDWARREAFILLHEREQLGLDPIDPNYIDPSKIVLPPDDKLTDDEIVI